MPIERQQITEHKPFCVDLHEKTFELFKNFLERYTSTFYHEEPPAPFRNLAEHHRFVLLCLKLLCTHLNLCVLGGLNSKVLGSQTKDLRVLLFRLVDIPAPADVQSAVREILNVGTNLLLPELNERVELLCEQLPQSRHLSQGQQMLLDIVLNSLENPNHIASILGYNVMETMDSKQVCATERLMTTLLQTFNAHTVSRKLLYCYKYKITVIPP